MFVYICISDNVLYIHVYIYTHLFCFSRYVYFQTPSQKMGLVDKTNPTSPICFLMALVTEYSDFRFGIV